MRHRKRKELRFDRKHRKHINLKWIPEVFGWVFQIVLVCLCAFVFVWYFGHQISNIGESMNPVIRNGDVVLVNRIVYDASTPKRGDIIVFKPKGNENLHSYIKRIIGLPGESVEIRDGEIYINNRKLNEKYETIAIKKAFGEEAYNVKVSSTKSMTGHLLGGAAAVEAIACVMAIREGIVPPTIGYKEPDPECDLDITPNKAVEMPINVAISNSLGFGGHNACILIKKV